MNKEWVFPSLTPEVQETAERLAQQLNISLPAAKLLVQRGLLSPEDARTYIRPSLQQLHDPFLMRDMDKAVERLTLALDRKEKILIYGDYDVDGTTAVAVVYRFLQRLTGNLLYYVPNRYTEGYGISFRGIDYAEQEDCTLMIALDCGIKAVEKVQYAKERGIDCIICDHHTPGNQLPEAVAVLNMKRADCPYPYKDLSGCGVGFKFMQALSLRRNLPEEWLWAGLAMLALSIASDIVSMTGENRILAHFGLEQLRGNPQAGLKALMEVSAVEPQKLTMTDVAFRLGPRINASGRMETADLAVRLLLTDSPEEAITLAREINEQNAQRRELDTSILEESIRQLETDPLCSSRLTTVVYHPTWHKGVLGIVASRLTDTYYRPTVVLTDSDNGLIAGSARSVAGFDLYSALESCQDLFVNFGGHAFAAGLSMRKDNLPLFRQRFENYLQAHHPETFVPSIRVEQEIQLSDITSQFFRIIQCLEPFGPDNPQPVFVTRHLINHRGTHRVGKMGEHLHLDLTDQSVAIAGIAFGMGDKALYIQNGNPIDVCYTLENNTYNGVTTLQMMVRDLHTCQENPTCQEE